MYIKTKLGVVVLLSKNTEYLRSSTKILLSTAMFFKDCVFWGDSEARVSLWCQ